MHQEAQTTYNEYLIAVKQELEHKLTYKNLDDKGRDISDILRGQIKILDDLIIFKETLKNAKDVKEAAKEMFNRPQPGNNIKDTK